LSGAFSRPKQNKTKQNKTKTITSQGSNEACQAVNSLTAYSLTACACRRGRRTGEIVELAKQRTTKH
jgi:hypothetical protein